MVSRINNPAGVTSLSGAAAGLLFGEPYRCQGVHNIEYEGPVDWLDKPR